MISYYPFSSLSAVRTGLEPATPGVTGRYSNQLNYRTIGIVFLKGFLLSPTRMLLCSPFVSAKIDDFFILSK